MKKVLISLSIIGIAAGAVVGGTIAFFNDTETSTGNIFTAGSIDLTVDSFGVTYNGEDIILPGSTWTARDLTDQTFFVFDDVKPGDFGTRHISLHADSNRAWACLIVHNGVDDENVLTNPEAAVGDVTSVVGELSQNLAVFAWQDNDSDSIYDPSDGEIPLLPDGSFFDVFFAIHIADADSGTPPLEPTGTSATRNISVAWCAGTQSVNHTTGVITCDGSGMGDEVQTDSFTADLTLYAEQHRNNPDFECSEVQL